MELAFADADLENLATDVAYTGGFPPGIVKAYRRRVQQILAAKDERDFYASKGLHFEKLKGDRGQERSMRLNKAVRLVVEIKEGEQGTSVVHVRSIEDYHRG